MKPLKISLWEDEYDRAVAKHAVVHDLPGTPLWQRRLDGPRETRPTEITFYRGLFGSGKARRSVTAPVTYITFDPVPATGAAFGVFHIHHAALDAANEKQETQDA